MPFIHFRTFVNNTDKIRIMSVNVASIVAFHSVDAGPHVGSWVTIGAVVYKVADTVSEIRRMIEETEARANDTLADVLKRHGDDVFDPMPDDTMTTYKFGDVVCKVTGDYQFEGIVRGVIIKKSGQVRYAVEDDRGCLCICSDAQLAYKPKETPLVKQAELCPASYQKDGMLYCRLRSSKDLAWANRCTACPYRMKPPTEEMPT